MDERIIVRQVLQITEALGKQTEALNRVHAELQKIAEALQKSAENGRLASR